MVSVFYGLIFNLPDMAPLALLDLSPLLDLLIIALILPLLIFPWSHWVNASKTLVVLSLQLLLTGFLRSSSPNKTLPFPRQLRHYWLFLKHNSKLWWRGWMRVLILFLFYFSIILFLFLFFKCKMYYKNFYWKILCWCFQHFILLTTIIVLHVVLMLML